MSWDGVRSSIGLSSESSRLRNQRSSRLGFGEFGLPRLGPEKMKMAIGEGLFNHAARRDGRKGFHCSYCPNQALGKV